MLVHEGFCGRTASTNDRAGEHQKRSDERSENAHDSNLSEVNVNYCGPPGRNDPNGMSCLRDRWSRIVPGSGCATPTPRQRAANTVHHPASRSSILLSPRRTERPSADWGTTDTRRAARHRLSAPGPESTEQINNHRRRRNPRRGRRRACRIHRRIRPLRGCRPPGPRGAGAAPPAGRSGTKFRGTARNSLRRRRSCTAAVTRGTAVAPHHPPEPHPAPLFVSDRRCCSGSVSRRTPGRVTAWTIGALRCRRLNSSGQNGCARDDTSLSTTLLAQWQIPAPARPVDGRRNCAR